MSDGEAPEGSTGRSQGLEDPRAPWEEAVEDPAAARAMLAVMFTDIVGSTELATTLGDKRWRELLEQHDTAVREQIARFEGREVDTAGDAFFATFGRPIQAVDCALESARAVRRLGLRIRAGIHMGECVVTSDKVRGVTVHIGARVGAKARGDEVLVSSTVREILRDAGLSFQDRGEQTLKGVDGRWRLFAVEPRVRDLEAELPPLIEFETPQPPTPLWKRPRAIAAGLALILAVAATTFVVTRGGGLSSVPADSVASIDAGSGNVTAARKVGRRPTGVVATGGGVWVANSVDRTVTRIGEDGRRDNIALGASPTIMAASPGLIWVGNADDGSVVRVDAATRAIVGDPIRTGNGLSGIAFGAGAVWVTNSVDGTVVRIDPSTGKILSTSKVGATLQGIVATDDAVWVASESAGTVNRIDPGSGSVVDAIQVGNGPRSLALGAGALWVANTFDGTVSRIDPETGSVGAAVRVGRDPRGIAIARGRVFVANETDSTISVIDAATNEVTDAITLRNAPMALAADGDRVWVSVRGGILNYKGGTLRFGSAFNEHDFSTFDPMHAWNPLGFSITTSVYDGLMAYKRAGGIEGSVAVPNLVERLLPPTNDGRTYSFRLRRGVRFSSGKELKASDVRASFERMFRIEAQSSVFVGAIAGSEACSPQACDLSKGIVTDDDAGTVIFNLRASVPEFPYFLAHPLVAILPADTPLEDLRYRPAPGTGPYMIANVKLGEERSEGDVPTSGELTLERNPHFRSRGAAQPDGYPDRILVSWGGTPEENLEAVKSGRVDWSVNALNGASDIEQLANEVPGQFHVLHQQATLFTTLNPNIPPTNDPRVRRAINLAVDRAAMAEVVGAPLGATVACQLLAPGVFGYVPYCPYTKNPSESGVWSGPDLAEAKRLVAESGTSGQRITLWAEQGHEWEPVIDLVADAMRKLGYRPIVRFREGFEIFTTALDDPKQYQVMLSGWFADLPVASNFVIPTFACPAFADRISGREDTTANVAWYCDPAFDAKIEAAMAAQEDDIFSSADLWTAVDRAITAAAPFVPYATLLNATLVSPRVGNIQSNPLTGVLLTQMWLSDRN